MYVNFVYKNYSFHIQFCRALTEEIRTAKLCTEVFDLTNHLLTKRYIPQSSMSPLRVIRVIVLSEQYCRFTVIW